MLRKVLCITGLALLHFSAVNVYALFVGDILVVDADAGALVVVDPLTGDRAIFSGFDGMGGVIGSGPDFDNPREIALDALGNILVTDTDLRAIFFVDPITGDRSIFSGFDGMGGVIGSGPNFTTDDPRSIALDLSGNILVTSRSNPEGVYLVDPITGDRSILTDDVTGLGPTFSSDGPEGIVIDVLGNILVADHFLDAIFLVDPVSGDRSILSGDPSSADIGTGPDFDRPRQIALDDTGNIFETDRGNDAIFKIDPLTGNRTIFSDFENGTGPDFSDARGITFDALDNILVTDKNLQALFLVNPITGNRSILSGNPSGLDIGLGPDFLRPLGVAVVVIPEPQTISLYVLGLFVIGLVHWLKRRV